MDSTQFPEWSLEDQGQEKMLRSQIVENKGTDDVVKQENKKLAESYANRIWNEKDMDAFNLLHQNCVIHSSLGDFHGAESMKTVVQAWLKGFPDLTVKNLSVIGEHDLVVIHWQAQGTHQGEFKGFPPTGRPISYAGVTIYRVIQSKISEYWAYLDMQFLLKQIG